MAQRRWKVVCSVVVVLLVAAVAKAGELEERLQKAKQGDSDSQLIMGSKYAEGDGVPQDSVEAMKWYRRAADQGNVLAQMALGLMYHEGDGIPQDGTEAAKWFRKAADGGDKMAKAMLKIVYHQGQGTPQDEDEDARRYSKAADQGEALPRENDVAAQLRLGFRYCDGDGVPQDTTEALKWFRKAAEKWSDPMSVKALNVLGVKYAAGQCGPLDYVQAYMWWSLCVSRTDGEEREDAILNLAKVTVLMTPSQIAEATGLAREWVVQHAELLAASGFVATPLTPAQSTEATSSLLEFVANPVTVAQDATTITGLDFMVDWPTLIGKRVRIIGGRIFAADHKHAFLKLPGGNVGVRPPWQDREDLRYLFKNCTGIRTPPGCEMTVTGTVKELAGEPELMDVDFDVPSGD